MSLDDGATAVVADHETFVRREMHLGFAVQASILGIRNGAKSSSRKVHTFVLLPPNGGVDRAAIKARIKDEGGRMKAQFILHPSYFILAPTCRDSRPTICSGAREKRIRTRSGSDGIL